MSMHETYDPNNIFAKIIRGEMPAVKILETDDVVSFMDIFPQSDGHCLVIPKQAQATNLFDLEADLLSILIKETQRVADAVRRALEPEGVRIVQFNGAEAGQTVFHIHFHIIPAYAGKRMGLHASGGAADVGELEARAAKIRAAL